MEPVLVFLPLVYVATSLIALVYFVAALSGYRLLRELAPHAFFKWRDIRRAIWLWTVALFTPKAPLPPSWQDAKWSVLWIATFLSVSGSFVLGLNHLKLIIQPEVLNVTVSRLFWIVAHTLVAWGLVFLHLGAYLLHRKPAGE